MEEFAAALSLSKITSSVKSRQVQIIIPLIRKFIELTIKRFTETLVDHLNKPICIMAEVRNSFEFANDMSLRESKAKEEDG